LHHEKIGGKFEIGGKLEIGEKEFRASHKPSDLWFHYKNTFGKSLLKDLLARVRKASNLTIVLKLI